MNWTTIIADSWTTVYELMGDFTPLLVLAVALVVVGVLISFVKP